MPIITPLFFSSAGCRDELEKFLAHEKAIGRDDLILPVYYVTAPVLEKADLNGVRTKLAGTVVDESNVQVLRKTPPVLRVVSTNLADLHKEPSFLAEMLTQVLNGTALEILEEQSSRPGVTGVLRDVRMQVADGSRLADAMRRHPRVFNELVVSMVRAGEGKS